MTKQAPRPTGEQTAAEQERTEEIRKIVREDIEEQRELIDRLRRRLDSGLLNWQLCYGYGFGAHPFLRSPSEVDRWIVVPISKAN